MSCVMRHKSHVTCHMSCVKCHMSHVTYHLPPVTERKVSLFLMAALKILAGDKECHELKESLMVFDLSYLSQRDKMRLLCIALKAYPTMEDVFERGKIGWEGYFFFENFKNDCNDIIFVVRAPTQHA